MLLFVFSALWKGKSRQSWEFVGVSGVFFFFWFLFFFFFSKLEMDADRREAAPGRERDRKHEEVSLEESSSGAQRKGKVKAGLRETLPQILILNVASQRGAAARSVAFSLFDLPLPINIWIKTTC